MTEQISRAGRIDRRTCGTVIEIRGAAQNNLKNLNLDIEPGTMTVVTGPSGSGKSSLAFDTLYAEGQRRYVETFSPYARQFLERCDRPKVDRIDGVPPAIAINQNNTVRTSRSTVGTMTELNDYLKLVFARDAHLFCGDCGTAVRNMSAADMFAELQTWAGAWADPRIAVCFTLIVPASLDPELAKAGLSARGFTHIIKEEKASAAEAGGASKNTGTATRLTVACDRFRLSRCSRERGVEAFEKALAQTRTGAVTVVATDEEGRTHERWFAAGLTCPKCLRTYAEPTPARFSFNSAVGACETCRGFGRVIGLDMGLVIPDETLTLADGAVKPWQGTGASSQCQKDMMRFAKRDHIRTNVAWKDLTAAERDWVINGEPGWNGNWEKSWYGIKAFFAFLESKAYKMHVRVMLSRFRSYNLCPSCKGARLKPESLFWRLGTKQAADAALGTDGTAGKGRYKRFVPNGMGAPAAARINDLPGLTLPDLMQLPVVRLKGFFETLAAAARDEASALVIDEILTRLNYLIDVGVGYLTLGRQSRTLSGGEVQRVNLTTALGTNLVDTLFVLDEPSVGLHPRDMDRVNAVMKKLKDAGNTLVVVEHDPQVMLAADRIIDMGPGSGAAGGSIVYDGPAGKIRSAHTLTGLYLSGAMSVDSPIGHVRPEQFHRWLTLKGASEHNLKHIDFRFPLAAMTAVTGVSGSGKSTLVGDVLVAALERKFGRPATPGAFEAIEGWQTLSDVVYVDQSPIGKSSRSNPAVYVGAFTRIRELFAATDEARERGYTAGTFSFNSGTGRCPTCQGAGFERVEMQFLSDVFLKCPDCSGRRYRPETLEVTINFAGRGEKSIADVLEMTVAEAIAYFKGDAAITSKLAPLAEVGLGYVLLGQSVSTLSGGEAQRLKLAEILAERNPRRAGAGKLYVFDEPTTGLHFDDIEKLLRALRRLVSRGNTVLVVEHNLDVIAASDWIVDLGPEGGDEGGEIVAEGTPETLEGIPASYTGRALAAYRGVIGPDGGDMSGTFAEDARPAPARRTAGSRSLQSIWRGARAGDMGIFGAREHNLKDISVVIPKKELTVVTGVSGSGKSTLAFGIIFSEGQRRYLESLNAYARSIAQPEARADVEQVTGIAPTVAIEQRTSRGGRKSTVSTLTEIQHFLRLLYVKLGVQHCPTCGAAVTSRTREAIIADIMTSRKGETVTIAAPVVVSRKGIYTDLAQWAANTLSVEHLRVDGSWVSTHKFPKLARYKEHTIELPLATLSISPREEAALIEAVEKALFHGHGVMTLLTGAFALTEAPSPVAPEARILSTKRACPHCMTSFPDPDPRLFSFNSKIGWCPTCFGTGRIIEGFDAEQTGEEAVWRDAKSTVCPDCHGARLNPVARAVIFEGRSICETTALSVDECLKAMRAVHLAGRSAAIGSDAIKEITSRLEFLQKVGLGYLALDRDAPSLSGGEAQRIRLASQLGSSLQGVCYVLDEPTIGLHPRDNARLIDTLFSLRDKGNTVVVVEHDEEMIRRADHIVDIGPGAGSRGGELIVEGSLEDVEAAARSITGRMLLNPIKHTGRARRPVVDDTARITLTGVTLHNLRHITAEFPLGRLIVLTGVSGSGKSTLARDVLLAELRRILDDRLAEDADSRGVAGLYCESIRGVEHIGRVLEVDQSPIGKTPRSCPATYVGFFNQIRDLYAATNEAQARGYGATRFSFNTPEGRCPVCEGQGEVTVEMNFLPDVKVLCEACRGMRFDEETLAVKWQGRSIGEILNLPVDDALEVFGSTPRIARPLALLQDVGLGYLRLGQPSSTLSGGEAQRIKLVTELAKAASPVHRSRQGSTFYILDEPTVGLHMADVEKLIAVLHRLVDAGNTVLVVEHNLDVMAEADWLIDLGPEGGPDGGCVMFAGEPAAAAAMDTPTGRAMKEFLASHAGADADPEK